MAKQNYSRLPLGGKSAFNWQALFISLPFLILETPIVEIKFDYIWLFWRWTLATLVAVIPVVLLFAVGDFIFFPNREKRPIPNWLIFVYGALLGFTYGAFLGLTTYLFNLQNENLALQVLERGINNALAGMLLMPLSALIGSSINIYNDDREALIAERMLVESQKTESKAVINSLRAQLSNKVDENLLRIIENSKDYFDTKSRSLEDNWELLAERLRSAALDTIRPFSHSLHRKGEERTYRVKANELASYVAYKFQIHPILTVLVYLVTTHRNYQAAGLTYTYIQDLLIKCSILLMLLSILKLMSKLKIFRNIYGYLISLLMIGIAHVAILRNLLNFQTSYIDSILIFALIFTVSLGMTFSHGGHAELEFLERRISEEQLEIMLLKREESRISRELAKYLHGTIQSRLMASAMGLEAAGRKGDVKALKKEAKSAYKNLKLPSESYFSTPANSLKEEIDKVIAKWTYLMTIQIKLDKKKYNLSADLVQDIGHVINEGLSNAFRHGNSDKVNIKLSENSGIIKIEIEDNGDGPSKGKGGLGSEWFTAIAGANWKLKENASGGTTLILEVSAH